ncbi:MAG: DUF2442 domain-containing protein, partial [Isosphaeraceae bacterium]
YVPTTALAKSVEFDDAMMRVAFRDGRVLCVPLAWFPSLYAATPEQRRSYPSRDDAVILADGTSGVLFYGPDPRLQRPRRAGR